MSRIRYLKPEFFFDEHIADLPLECRLAFQGLWVNADKLGRLEDVPKRLKALIFPYDSFDMEKILNRLTIKPFIDRYEVDGRNYIQVLNWDKHQHPHKTERESIIPAPDPLKVKIKEKIKIKINSEVGVPLLNNGELTVKQPLNNVYLTVKPVIGKLDFDLVWAKYPKKDGRKEAERHFKASVKTDQDFIDIQKALDNYTKCDTVAKGFIKNGSTWFNNWRDWIDYKIEETPVSVAKRLGLED